MWFILILILGSIVSNCESDGSSNTIDNGAFLQSYGLEWLLDSERQPCQDFYGYVCGCSGNQNQTLREKRRQHEQQRFQQFITSKDNEKLPDAELKLKNFHKSCETNRGVEVLKKSLFYQNTGGWPALDVTTKGNFSWEKVIGNFHEIGVFHFFETVISIKSNKRIVNLQPDTTRRYTMRRFEQLVDKVMRDYGVEASRVPVVALEVLSLERRRRDLVKAEVNSGSASGSTRNPVEFSYAEFKRSAMGNISQQIDWDAYFKQVLGKTLRPNDSMIVEQLPRLIDYVQLLQSTTVQRLANWIWIDYLMDIVDSNCQQLSETHMPDVYAQVVQRPSIDRIQMAQLYSAVGKAYSEELATSAWIDEMSQQSSQQFLGRAMHLTLNGDDGSDAAYRDLLIGKRNFYRNLVQLQRFQRQQLKRQQVKDTATSTNAATATQTSVKEYMQIFRAIGTLLGTRNLTAPLNYLLVGEHFAKSFVAAGGSSHTAGAWRSSDSDTQFAAFDNCTAAVRRGSVGANVNSNDILLGLLSQRLALRCYNQWLEQQQQQQQVASRAHIQSVSSLRRLYFIGSLLVDCRLGDHQRHLRHAVLRNSPEFTEAFGCRPGDPLYARRPSCTTSNSN